MSILKGRASPIGVRETFIHRIEVSGSRVTNGRNAADNREREKADQQRVLNGACAAVAPPELADETLDHAAP